MDTPWNRRTTSRAEDWARPWYGGALSLVADLAPGARDVVEVGCGNGEFAALAKRQLRHIHSYLGLDGHLPSLDKARANGIETRQVNFEEPLPLDEGCADLVVSLEVIEHVARAEQLLESINQALRPGGLLILSTPNVGFAAARVRYLLKAEVGLEGIHLRFFNRERLEELLDNAGFSLEARRSVMPLVGYNTVARHLGSPRRHVVCPRSLEPWLAVHFVWAMRKRPRAG
jgi:SAM-dependent methyltransferase